MNLQQIKSMVQSEEYDRDTRIKARALFISITNWKRTIG